MHWKILIVVIVLTAAIATMLYGGVLYKEYISPDYDENKILVEFLSGSNRKLKIALTKDTFDSLVAPTDMSVYYFPDECPTYKEGTFILVENDDIDKYYVPEKNHLLMVEKNHKWTNPCNFVVWKK